LINGGKSEKKFYFFCFWNLIIPLFEDLGYALTHTFP